MDARVSLRSLEHDEMIDHGPPWKVSWQGVPGVLGMMGDRRQPTDAAGAFYLPSRYHMLPSAKSSRPSPKKPPNSGTRDTDFRTLSLVVLSPIQSLPAALAAPRTGTMPGSDTPVDPAM